MCAPASHTELASWWSCPMVNYFLSWIFARFLPENQWQMWNPSALRDQTAMLSHMSLSQPVPPTPTLLHISKWINIDTLIGDWLKRIIFDGAESWMRGDEGMEPKNSTNGLNKVVGLSSQDCDGNSKWLHTNWLNSEMWADSDWKQTFCFLLPTVRCS